MRSVERAKQELQSRSLKFNYNDRGESKVFFLLGDNLLYKLKYAMIYQLLDIVVRVRVREVREVRGQPARWLLL